MATFTPSPAIIRFAQSLLASKPDAFSAAINKAENLNNFYKVATRVIRSGNYILPKMPGLLTPVILPKSFLKTLESNKGVQS